MKLKTMLALAATAFILAPSTARAIKLEPIKYGNFNSCVTRHVKESSVIGGNTRTVYAIGPATTINGNKAYSNLGGSPWATSNVMPRSRASPRRPMPSIPPTAPAATSVPS